MTPSLVKEIARRLPASLIVDRLLTDPRMNGIWPTLLRQHANERLVDNLLLWVEGATPLGLTRDDIAAYSPAERGAAAFFVRTVDALTTSPTLRTRIDYEAQAKRFADAVDLCAQERGHSGGALRDALDIVAQHFAYSARIMESACGPEVLERSSANRGDDALRIQARLVAAASLSIYGKRNFTALATVASVATGLAMTKKSIENWTRDLR